jgi:hypothetical protein
LWFGIEQRFKKIEFNKLKKKTEWRDARVIVHNFNALGKGSYEFWSKVNSEMSIKDKI